MTLLPCPKAEIAVYRGDTIEPDRELRCAHPTCAVGFALETHHVVRRTETGGPVRWVVINGVILLNERKVCHDHHLQLTGEVGGHKAWIRYLEGAGWMWYAPAPPGASGQPGQLAAVDKLGCLWLPVGPLKVVA